MPIADIESQPSGTEQRITLFMTGLAGGGAERVMLTLAEAFAGRCYAVDLVVTNAQGPLAADVPEAVRLVDLGARRIMTSLPALVLYFRREKPSIMLSAMAPANCLAVWARQLSGASTRLVLSEHSHLSIASKEGGSRRARLLPSLMRRAYPKADGIVAVSGGVADDLAATLGLPRERIQVIYNPVVTPRMLEMSREPLEHEWFGANQPPVILSVGRLTAAKDYGTLLRAFAALRERRTARLMILGEGEERSALEQLAGELGIQEDIALPGFVSNPYKYMRAAAVFVLSSRWEGFGNVLVEAMVCGSPAVATDCPSGPAEIFDYVGAGLLVDVGNPHEIRKMIETALISSNTFLIPEESILKGFSQSAIADLYLNYLIN